MKNKYIHDLVKQLHYDVRTSEENVKNLANDLLRVERLFNELWTFVYENKGDIASTPKKQTLKCNFCNNWSKDYKIHSDANGYITTIQCKTCLIEEENERVEETKNSRKDKD